MQVDFSHCQTDKCWRYKVGPVKRCEAAHELSKVFRCSGRDTISNRAMHTEKGDDAHLIPNNLDVDLHILTELREVAYVLSDLISRMHRK